jgi:ketopantoate reductase
MLQDVLARRPIEIGVRNGAIVRRGTGAGVPVLLNQAVTTLVNGLEQSWE